MLYFPSLALCHPNTHFPPALQMPDTMLPKNKQQELHDLNSAEWQFQPVGPQSIPGTSRCDDSFGFTSCSCSCCISAEWSWSWLHREASKLQSSPRAPCPRLAQPGDKPAKAGHFVLCNQSGTLISLFCLHPISRRLWSQLCPQVKHRGFSHCNYSLRKTPHSWRKHPNPWNLWATC